MLQYHNVDFTEQIGGKNIPFSTQFTRDTKISGNLPCQKGLNFQCVVLTVK